MPRLENMKKTETSTEQDFLYRCLFAALSMRNRRGDKGVLDSSGALSIETMCDSTCLCFHALPGLPSYWEVSNNPRTTTISLEDWHEVVWIAKNWTSYQDGKDWRFRQGFQRNDERWIKRRIWRWKTLIMLVQPSLVVSSTTPMSLPKIDILCYVGLFTRICQMLVFC